MMLFNKISFVKIFTTVSNYIKTSVNFTVYNYNIKAKAVIALIISKIQINLEN